MEVAERAGRTRESPSDPGTMSKGTDRARSGQSKLGGLFISSIFGYPSS